MGGRAAARWRALGGPAISAATLVALAIGLELALRIYHGQLLSFESILPRNRHRLERPTAVYDAELGWTPAPGRFELATGGVRVIDGAGLRSNGSPRPPPGRPLLAVGDSFTFGDEVRDGDTWPAHLEQRIGRPVLNAGVFGYGVDQAVLRGEALLDAHAPEWTLLGVIGDDVSRTEFSYYWAPKPYFELVGGRLERRNIPVPRDAAPSAPFHALRGALGYSRLAHAILRRAAPRWWWYAGAIEQRHDRGEAVSVALVARLAERARARGGRLLVITLAADARMGNDGRLSAFVAQARAEAVPVLDLAPEIQRLEARGDAGKIFLPRGHYTGEMNRWVAERIAEHLTSAARSP